MDKNVNVWVKHYIPIVHGMSNSVYLSDEEERDIYVIECIREVIKKRAGMFTTANQAVVVNSIP